MSDSPHFPGHRRPTQVAGPPIQRGLAATVALCAALPFCIALLAAPAAHAQGTPLKPPIAPPGSQSTTLKPPVAAPQLKPPSTAPAASTPSKPAGAPAATATAAQSAAPSPTGAAVPFQTIKVAGKRVDIRNLSNGEVLKGKNGKTISVGRIRQLQARIAAASTTPAVVAKPGQTLRTLSAQPASTRIVLPGGKVTRAADLAKIEKIRAKLGEKRVVVPVPVSQPNASAQAVVGRSGFTMADALKRPANEMIQVGTRKYTAEQLRTIDAQLKASKRDPRGLVERAGRSAANVRGGK